MGGKIDHAKDSKISKVEKDEGGCGGFSIFFLLSFCPFVLASLLMSGRQRTETTGALGEDGNGLDYFVGFTCQIS